MGRVSKFSVWSPWCNTPQHPAPPANTPPLSLSFESLCCCNCVEHGALEQLTTQHPVQAFPFHGTASTCKRTPEQETHRVAAGARRLFFLFLFLLKISSQFVQRISSCAVNRPGRAVGLFGFRYLFRLGRGQVAKFCPFLCT